MKKLLPGEYSPSDDDYIVIAKGSAQRISTVYHRCVGMWLSPTNEVGDSFIQDHVEQGQAYLLARGGYLVNE